jgi:disulfide oxidoreductase YuzD
MILDKLAKNIVANVGTVIWPLYRIFKERLELIKFEDIKIIHGTHNEFKATIRNDIEKNGLLCPLVVDKDLNLRNGNHRFKIIKNMGTLLYFIKHKPMKKLIFFPELM